ncbi:MAG: aminotransferase class III-fold pyridoxal phosphate-dependent enzyme, partial [Desulfuromonadales bacterium]|nr:aminotransferase class III-fold pyridoxal phosphate-dependent enzyme [Desulfuromonadales bacterium]NIS42010.1 aminotransferase class III-fold pyridoxal phosphate-dependent enzyme [Desulfuromonadales bacterium]
LDRESERFLELPHVGEFRRCGMVAALELVEKKDGNIPYPWQERKGREVFRRALERGALLRPLGNVVYFMPPLTTGKETLQEL